MKNTRTEVLVVGAGPVGLMTAVLLAEAGVDVCVIDREERTAARSYACALHPATLSLLKRLGMHEAVLADAGRLPTLAFYDGPSREKELRLTDIDPEFPFLSVIPQSALEQALEERLRSKGGQILWNHRFSAFQEENDIVIATVEVLGGTSKGYIVPHWESVVKNTERFSANFLIGADGHHSLVRHRMGIDYQHIAGAQLFGAYEFISDENPIAEMRVVLDERTTNVLWPLPGNRCRWTFQIVHSEMEEEFPEKARSALRVSHPESDERVRQYIERTARKRAPWFTAPIKEIAWCTEVPFEQRLTKSFGQGLCWLAGDAAHQTGPVGMQSMNTGFLEAEMLAGLLQKILRDDAPPESLQQYNDRFTREWRFLLGLSGGLKPAPDATAWIKQRAERLLPCLPGSVAAIPGLASQLGLQLV